MYKIILGKEGPTDNMLAILNTVSNNKVEFEIESPEWRILETMWSMKDQCMEKFAEGHLFQRILSVLIGPEVLKFEDIDLDYDSECDTDDSYNYLDKNSEY